MTHIDGATARAGYGASAAIDRLKESDFPIRRPHDM
jgi:hypothetical protein